MTRRRLSIALAVAASLAPLAVAGTAGAVVVNDQGTAAGVALVPGTTLPSSVIPVTAGVPCLDPALPFDLSLAGQPHALPPDGLCHRGTGRVLSANETFALTWDPLRRYWQNTRHFVEQFLRDVADGSGTLSSPYAVTSQYTGSGGRADNKSLYGGGCIDYGDPGGSSCVFPNAVAYARGNNYPAPNGCPLTGSNLACVTDAQLQRELTTMVANMGLVGRTDSARGYLPLIVMLLPNNVETCLDASGTLCSANGTSAGQFCSYHSHVAMPDGTDLPYVVQPWTAGTACDQPNLPPVTDPAIDAGRRLVSPLSAGQIASIVNPDLDSWIATDGAEINDHQGCSPRGYPTDGVTVGAGVQNPYYLQPEFNNAGVLESDPNAPACAEHVDLMPSFVVPSPVDPGDVVAFDGSVSQSTLMVPYGQYQWDFGDGTKATGPSVVHSYAVGGTYTVQLTVVDRGGNRSAVSQQITVVGAASVQQASGLHASLRLAPQGIKGILRSGVAVVVTSTAPADAIATVLIPRAAARQAHLASGRGTSVVIGRGTVSGIRQGRTSIHLHLSRAVAAKLRSLRHVLLTVRITLIAASGRRAVADVAGHY